MNYKNVPNVDYARYENDSDKENGADIEGTGRIDEMYYDNGRLYIGLEGPEAFHSIHIPVFLNRKDDWAGFVNALNESLEDT